jgi:hypothetical protein
MVDAGRFGFARLAARDFAVPALGYVVPNRVSRCGRAALRQITLFVPMRVQL